MQTDTTPKTVISQIDINNGSESVRSPVPESPTDRRDWAWYFPLRKDASTEQQPPVVDEYAQRSEIYTDAERFTETEKGI